MLQRLYSWVQQTTASSKSSEQLQQISWYRQLQKDVAREQSLDTPLHQLRVTVVDLETTGFYPNQGDQILSIGAVKTIGAELFEDSSYYTCIRVPEALTEEIKMLTGLTAEELEDGSSLKEALTRFFQFSNTDILVAHHAAHEKAFLGHMARFELGAPFLHRLLDTSIVTRILAPDSNCLSLDEWCEFFDIDISGRHHALHDAVMAAKIWVSAIEALQFNGYKTLADVYHVASTIPKNKYGNR
ncbi:exonuclease domain-containing protein [Salsuginibacillus kocurii]|uniref:exonuclease domain-containing protein n=1 Tax=Salsuginibacillus kocurii TaxID=427078 RepID=UPI00036F5381|nr:exonuclease domain-containing protein [Salsuginibacillus kocurii]